MDQREDNVCTLQTLVMRERPTPRSYQDPSSDHESTYFITSNTIATYYDSLESCSPLYMLVLQPSAWRRVKRNKEQLGRLQVCDCQSGLPYVGATCFSYELQAEILDPSGGEI
jgi:hypothetical protein